MSKKVVKPSSRKQTKYEFLRKEFDCKIDGLRETLKSHFKSVTNNIFDNISNLKDSISTHQHDNSLNPNISALNHLVEHAQEGIEKCFERIEELEKLTTELNESLLEFEGSDYDERITDLENSQIEKRLIACEHNCHSLWKKNKNIEKALENYREYKTGIEDLETDTMYLKQRIEKLEHFFSGKIKNPIYDAIEIHVEKFNERISDLEKWKKAAIEKNIQDVNRMRDLEKAFLAAKERVEMLEKHLRSYHELILGACPIELEKTIRDNMRGKIPHKCPVCDFSGAIQLESMEEITRFKDVMKTDDGRYFIWCKSCEGKGIVWG